MDGRHRMLGGQLLRAGALLAMLSLVSVACGSAASPSAPASQAASQPAASESQGPLVTPVPGQGGLTSDGRPLIRWFVGLGTGERPNHIEVEQKVVDAFNAAHNPKGPDYVAGNSDIVLSLEIYRNAVAYDTLATQIATNNAPDIIGPIGVRALQSFGDQLLDLKPYIDKASIDLSEIPQGLIDVYNIGGKQIGIPMAVYPSFIYYNKTLFKEAGLAEPPHKVGDKYDGKDWTWATVAELAKKLTVDTNGNDASSAAFDPAKIDQYGLDAQWTENDARAWSTIFGGSGSAVADDGKTAQWPDNWKQGLRFYYDGIWKDHFIPAKPAVDGMAGGNSFQSGQIAMDVVHLWFTCCIYPTEGAKPVTDWDIAVLPASSDGKVTSKLHADTIGILSSSKHPDEAFEVLNFLAGSSELTQIWGAMPARASQQDAFFAGLTNTFKPLTIDWQVAKDMLAYPDVPSHEAFMPNFQKADAANKALGSKLWTTGGLDVNAEVDKLVTELQGIFNEATP
ncbi:MAG TPA: sugar ABC transporter substrate-binding protein [Candidatus Limnocylindrales bacterium]|nr:sugar ABC transporter substrate-binding protein [Candidatus Limnocylindrales bacterium]